MLVFSFDNYMCQLGLYLEFEISPPLNYCNNFKHLFLLLIIIFLIFFKRMLQILFRPNCPTCDILVWLSGGLPLQASFSRNSTMSARFHHTTKPKLCGRGNLHATGR